MKINLTKECDKNTLISHIVLECMTDALYKQIGETSKKGEGVVSDVKLMVDGKELDIKIFADEWESQVDRMIREAATELLNEKFSSISDTVEYMSTEVTDFQEKIKEHIMSSKELLQENDGKTNRQT